MSYSQRCMCFTQNQQLCSHVADLEVRLPVPSWDEVEATRTYGSSFERLQATQMLRVPFVMGQQKSRVLS
eukprot:2181211-Amphidinium_carterae.1